MTYECHITFISGVLWAKKAVEDIGWKFSSIDGDPDLGPGSRCYATKHFPKSMELDEVIERLTSAWNILAGKDCKVTRLKIEEIVYDVKF